MNRFLFVLVMAIPSLSMAQPNWTAIKNNATFMVADTNYLAPYIQPIQVGGWEDGLFITRDGKHLYSTYMPIDIFSWLGDLSPCINFDPYYRPPLLGIDTLTNPFGCPNYIHSDIVLSSKTDTSLPFNPWTSSNLATPATFEGGADGVLLNSDTFDVFVFTQDLGQPNGMDIRFMKNVPINPNTSSSVTILSSTGQEDNPHIERLNSNTLLLFFDRDRFVYYSLSYDNGNNWQTPVLITSVLNDQSPYDVQPHLWYDGNDWWVYFCADNTQGVRGIYKSKQLIAGNWDSWSTKELVIEGSSITGGYGQIFGIGEPTLTQWGDLSFVVIYGNTNLNDSTDVFDCDPWILKRKNSPLSTPVEIPKQRTALRILPNPANENITIFMDDIAIQKSEIEIFNMKGVLVKELFVMRQSKISIADLPKGLYVVQMKSNPIHWAKFIKQ